MASKVIVFWEGLPACGVLLNSVLPNHGSNLIVYATRPMVPFKELERHLDFPVFWIKSPLEIIIRHWLDTDIKLFFHTGWRRKSLLLFDLWLRFRGTRTALIVDNPFTYSIRQRVGRWFCKLFLTKVISKVVVVGSASKSLVSFLGFDDSRIVQGGYGASSRLYFPPMRRYLRDNVLLFVGQLIDRKGVDLLASAYLNYRMKGGIYTLRVIGAGPRINLLSGAHFEYLGFLQPEEVASEMRKARCLVLPSRFEHWGTVVCEALACGCLAIVTDHVFSHFDLIEDGINGRVVECGSVDELEHAFWWLQSLRDDFLRMAVKKSIEKSEVFNEKGYGKMFDALMEE
jgi:glycosyltransferase involved in cell wall biosynthesis